MTGSPPQVRGKPLLPQNGHGLSRITPAGAGKTKTPTSAVLLARDHPRRCGENQSTFISSLYRAGSPPQVRGKPLCCRHRDLRSRITPAGAGKTSIKRYTTSPIWDHPRRCGENRWPTYEPTTYLGSPPQVRGKLNYYLARKLRERITPAGAGKTRTSGELSALYKDHPRRCGENGIRYMMKHTEMGSPPQVRGKHVGLSEIMFMKRITPAGAGKTEIGTETYGLFKDHPRRCGENDIVF